jgi:hypothetical protein
MVKFITNSITLELISKYLKEGIESNFNEVSIKTAIAKIEEVTPCILDLIKSQLNVNNRSKKSIEIYNENLECIDLIREKYRDLIQRHSSSCLIQLHLNFLILFNQLEIESEELKDIEHRKIWAGLIKDFVTISREENK